MLAALKAKLTVAAWKTKPSWAVGATEDWAIASELLRKIARRIGANATEVKGINVVFASQPKAVAGVIEAAAQGARQSWPRIFLDQQPAPWAGPGDTGEVRARGVR